MYHEAVHVMTLLNFQHIYSTNLFFLRLNNLYKTAFLHHYGLHMFDIYCKGNKMPVFYNLKYLTVAQAENYNLRN